jgi:hypothetical protein
MTCYGYVGFVTLDMTFRSFSMCVLALDLCLVDLRSCRIAVPLVSCKGAVHVCQALMRMQRCNIAGGKCSVLASHNAICNMAHVVLHSIDACGLAAGLSDKCNFQNSMQLTSNMQSREASCTLTMLWWTPSASLPSLRSAPCYLAPLLTALSQA